LENLRKKLENDFEEKKQDRDKTFNFGVNTSEENDVIET
jgi:hypothetical protein